MDVRATQAEERLAGVRLRRDRRKPYGDAQSLGGAVDALLLSRWEVVVFWPQRGSWIGAQLEGHPDDVHVEPVRWRPE